MYADVVAECCGKLAENFKHLQLATAEYCKALNYVGRSMACAIVLPHMLNWGGVLSA